LYGNPIAATSLVTERKRRAPAILKTAREHRQQRARLSSLALTVPPAQEFCGGADVWSAPDQNCASGAAKLQCFCLA
jgi:hypothetical protein